MERVKVVLRESKQLEKDLDELGELKQKYKLAMRNFDNDTHKHIESIGRHFLLNTVSGYHHD